MMAIIGYAVVPAEVPIAGSIMSIILSLATFGVLCVCLSNALFRNPERLSNFTIMRVHIRYKHFLLYHLLRGVRGFLSAQTTPLMPSNNFCHVY